MTLLLVINYLFQLKADTDNQIIIRGARVNNLKNISVSIPREKLVVITGLSGSGKSSLAFDTLYAEGQRRYVESLSSYARQFMGRMAKPEVDYILGISPAVAIEQKVNTSNPRSTVGTSTEIYEYLKLLYARIGRTFSPVSGVEVKRHSVSDVVDFIYSLDEGCKVTLYSPLEVSDERPLVDQLEILQQEGFVRISVNGQIERIEDFLYAASHVAELKMNDPMLLVDRISVKHNDDDQTARISESVQTAFFEGRGSCIVEEDSHGDHLHRHAFSNRFEADGITFEKPNPNFFSFNNPYGACPTCQGYGQVIGIDEDLVVPNKTKSVYEEAVICWKGEKMGEWRSWFIRQSSRNGFPIHTPYNELTDDEKDLLWHGNGSDQFPCIDNFFKWVETQQYKIQYRVMLARYRGKTTCPNCKGSRLRPDAAYVKICGKSIVDLNNMPVSELVEFLDEMEAQLSDYERDLTKRILIELHNRVGYLMDVGLGYLTLSRMSNTLSGGESQRINLSTSLGSSLVGSMYILDEPSIGLHSRDTERLINVLKQLRDLGNTVIVVEHDEDIIRAADYIIDIGPEAGRLGGEVVFEGDFAKMQKAKDGSSLTADYLMGRKIIEVPRHRRKWRDRILVKGAYANNLQKTDVEFPLGVLTVVTGVSGSGKTSLVKGVLYDVLQRRFDSNREYVGKCAEIEGDFNRVSSIELVDQNPIGRSSRSNPATYIKAYDEIRQLFSMQPLAKARGLKPGYFSFNVEGGRCEACEGEGYITVGMQFMADVHLVCEECHGSRFKDEALEITYHNKNISEILEMTVDQALDFFSSNLNEEETTGRTRSEATVVKSILNRLQPLQDVGLGYLKLGQSSSSLSGGEAQRVKLASFLVKGENEKPVLFIFDEPSTGLHFHDIQKLIKAFNTLIDKGHSIVVIEHHHDIIKVADWVIDMGPEGGKAGGKVVFAGTPEQLVKQKDSYTGRFLKDKLK